MKTDRNRNTSLIENAETVEGSASKREDESPYTWDTTKTLIDYLENVRGLYKDRPAYSQQGQTLTYDQMVRLSRKVASYLQHHPELNTGDRIAVQLPNTLLYPILVWGILQAGMVVVNLNPQYTVRETEKQLKDADVRGWFCADISAHLIEEVRGHLACPLIVVCKLFELHPWTQRNVFQFILRYRRKAIKPFASHNVLSFRHVLREGASRPWKKPHRNPDDLAMLQYTGGSSGVSMGAMLTHANLVANMEQLNHFLRHSIIPGQEILIAPLPIYHIFSFTVHCAVALLSGSHNILILDASNIAAVVSELKRWKFTIITGVNTLFFALMRLQSLREVDFSQLKFAIAGGMKLDPAVAKKWEEITRSPILEGFGMTELSPVACWNPCDANRIGTVGIALPQTEMKVMTAAGHPINVPEVGGELWVRGPQVMKGYWRHEEQTSYHLDKDGWMRTGDLASFDRDGYWKIIGRKKRMILVSGFNVYPNEVETVLRSHPSLIDALVVGRMHPVNGEVIKAYVISENHDLTAQEIKDFCRRYLTSYKIPKQIEIVAKLPESETPETP